MSTAIIHINPTEYGLDIKRASEIEAAFKPMLEKMTVLESEFNRISALPVGKETSREAKRLRLEYVRVRTGTAAIHKDLKAFYLAGGRFVDGWKNAQQFAAQGIEAKLEEIETHFERIEQQRIAAIESARVGELHALGTDVTPSGLGVMDDTVWQSYITGVRVARDARIKAEQEAEEKRLAAIEAERVERERIRMENERLKAERVEMEKKAAAEAAERAKAEAAERARVDAERKAAAEKARVEREAIEAKLAAERAEREKAEAAERALRVQAERKAAEDARLKREEEARNKDKAHRKSVHQSIRDSLVAAAGEGAVDAVVAAIVSGSVPNIIVKY